MNYWLLQDALTDIKANIIGKHFPFEDDTGAMLYRKIKELGYPELIDKIISCYSFSNAKENCTIIKDIGFNILGGSIFIP